jgi:hypothetical protein
MTRTGALLAGSVLLAGRASWPTTELCMLLMSLLSRDWIAR